MKVAVTSVGETMDSAVDPRFGRAAKIIIVDTETGEHVLVDNAPSLNAAQGAGVLAAEAVSRLNAEFVITGHCGPKAFRALDAAGIGVILGVGGTVADAIRRFKEGELAPAGGADVEGHGN